MNFRKVTNSEVFQWGLLIIAGYFIYKTMKKTQKITVTTINAVKFVNSTLTAQEASTIATQIKNAWGFFNDDEDAIYAAFNKLNRLIDLQYIEELYNSTGDNLYNDMRRKLNDKEREKVNLILQQKGINYRY